MPTDLQRTVGITTARARTVVAIARAVADGTLTCEVRRTSPSQGRVRPDPAKCS